MYSKKIKNRYQKIHRSAMRKRHFSRKNIDEYFYKKSRNLTWQTKVIFYFIIFLLFYLIYLLLFSSYFKIDKIFIEGNEEISESEILNKCHDYLKKPKLIFLKNDNFFFFNVEDLKEELSKYYYFDKLEIKKEYFSSLYIKLKEKSHKMFYVINDTSFLVDENGFVISRFDYDEVIKQNNKDKDDSGEKIIIKEIPEEIITNQKEIDEQNSKIVRNHDLYRSTNSSSTVFIWQEDEENNMIVKEVDVILPQKEYVYSEYPQIGSKIFSADLAQKILYLDANYKLRFGENRSYYNWKSKESDYIIMISKSNYKIYFKLDENIDSELSNLYRYVVEENNNLKNIKYIDLRQNNQIIIK